MDMNKINFKNNLLLVGSAELNRALLQNSYTTLFKPIEPQKKKKFFCSDILTTETLHHNSYL